jgi:ABC-type nickel/cobalt efflux system permease component RcnA
MKIEKKSGLQYFSLYPMTAGKASKIASIILTLLNAVTAVGFYLLYLNYLKNVTPKESDGQLSILTILSCGIIFWGGTYMIYGSVYGAKRIKAIIKKKREKRKQRREAKSTSTEHK